MHALSTTIQADPDQVDAGIAVVRDESMPVLMEREGCVGLSMLCDRSSGRCIVTSSWASERAMRAAARTERDLRRRAVDAMGGGRAVVDDWEVALMHRVRTAGDSPWARVTWAGGDPAGLAEGFETFPVTLLPRLDQTEGFCGLSMLVDQHAGRLAATAVYRDRSTMEAARGQVEGIREALAGHLGMAVTGLAEFEVAIRHLRVPELV